MTNMRILDQKLTAVSLGNGLEYMFLYLLLLDKSHEQW